MDNEEKEIDLLFKQFKSHVKGLMYCEDELVDLKLQLKGIKRTQAKTGIDEAHPDGTKIYKNNIIELEESLVHIRHKRNYHLFAVQQVMRMLQTLNDDEVELLELYYWKSLPLKVISNRFDKYRYSESYLYKQIQSILDKMKVLS